MARQLNRKITAILGAAALLVVSHQALATTLSASATMDWSGLTIEFLPDGLGYSVSGEYSYVSGYGVPFNDSEPTDDWTTPISIVGATNAASASAIANVESLSATAEIQGDTDTLRSVLVQYDTYQGYDLFSNAIRYGNLAISGGSGILVVTVPV